MQLTHAYRGEITTCISFLHSPLIAPDETTNDVEIKEKIDNAGVAVRVMRAPLFPTASVVVFASAAAWAVGVLLFCCGVRKLRSVVSIFPNEVPVL